MTGPSALWNRDQVLDALERGGSVKAAAALLKVSRTTLYDYLRRYEIEVKRAITAA